MTGGCDDDALKYTLTLPDGLVNKAWVSEGAVLMKTGEPDEAGKVKYDFRFKFGTSGDRIAFAIPASANLGVTTDDFSGAMARCNGNCNDVDSYTTYGPTGNRAECDQTVEYTSGDEYAGDKPDAGTTGGDQADNDEVDKDAADFDADAYAVSLNAKALAAKQKITARIKELEEAADDVEKFADEIKTHKNKANKMA